MTEGRALLLGLACVDEEIYFQPATRPTLNLKTLEDIEFDVARTMRDHWHPVRL